MELQKLIDGLKAHKSGAASYESVDEAIRVFEAMRDVDGEKVCKGLDCCVLRDPDDHRRCGECPYNPHAISNEPCVNELKFNALALIRQQQERIKELGAGPKWISVKDKLPDKDQEVLGLMDGATIRVMSYRYDDDGMSWEDVYGYFNSDDRVSHWMPLPEPPKEEEHAAE